MVFFCNGVGMSSKNIDLLCTTPVVLSPKKISLVDWKPILLNILKKNLFFDILEKDSVLLVNIIKNNTNGILQIYNITNTLIQCIIENVKSYSVINMDTLYYAYRIFGVFPEYNENSYNFSIKIANYLKANYVLYSIACGNADKPNLEFQLISVKSGEIIYVMYGAA
ncbi:penicillin-binding protein activator LpoB [Candidatus Blochmannia ocreatus (nom. nud.)]|uniref:Penicillin-binding protein activator LpoB n=1 Tax=Candidatus Blochmannia ocreatus (nom. nud.) TaxID=251538 RepID=A0ABY4SSE8_9ENTR|nr:penicillin-binding protein activator LpoB [Candidatus Blochmannia ocreatus]URJ24902.1 penicillin-binding protein activator LpoB [Candidatus Blochmannia ocreatus]